MSTTKRIIGNYTIQTLPSGQINLDSGQVVINGNLVVTGNSQSIVSTDSAITDHTITLNNGVATPNPLGANIIVDRGTSPNVSLSWNETVQNWQITTNGTTYANIANTLNTLANVYGDKSPQLGGNLNIVNQSIYDSGNTVTFYTGTVSSGKSGIFVDNSNATQQELATKSAAVAFSIIFG